MIRALIEHAKDRYLSYQLIACEVYKDHLYRLTLQGPRRVYFLITLQKPLIGFLALHEMELLPWQPLKEFKSILGQSITDIICETELKIVGQSLALIFPLQHKAQPHLSFEKSLPSDTQLLQEPSLEEQELYKEAVLAFAFQEQRAYQRKIQRQIGQLEKRRNDLPEIIRQHEEELIFMLENQDRFKGSQISKAYKKGAKLKKQSKVIGPLIEAYRKKLLQPPPSLKKDLPEIKEEKKQARVFYTRKDEVIKVARSAKHADRLTFKEAHGNHFWFHVDNYPGAHVLILSSQPSSEALEKARFLAKYYSKAKDEPSCVVIQTQIKYLKRGKNPGQVFISQKQSIQVKHDEKLREELFPSFIAPQNNAYENLD